ncbi:MAG: DNA repair protein RecN, partial [Marmoricola sp.]
SYASALESDPARLAGVSERRAALTSLTRKYGETIDEVLAWSATSARRLLELDDTDDRIERLGVERQRLRADLSDLAEQVSSARSKAASRLAGEVSGELNTLAMPHARLEITVSQHDDENGLEISGRTVRFGPDGVDGVELLLSANVGAEPRPLAKGASGGELSRVMLALEVSLAGTSPVPTLVFDEVDAGVGGKAAVEVGRRLAMLARSAQVVVVTHLPQVAAFADRHVVVHKASDGLVTTSGLTVLDEAARVRELSRMLAGLEESDTALAHAQELLATARAVRHPE